MFINYDEELLEQLKDECDKAKYKYDIYRAKIILNATVKAGGVRALARLINANPATISKIINMNISCSNKVFKKVMEVDESIVSTKNKKTKDLRKEFENLFDVDMGD